MVMAERETERTIGAYTILSLVEATLLPRSEVTRACMMLGITKADLDRARRRIRFQERRGLNDVILVEDIETDPRVRQGVTSVGGPKRQGTQRWSNRRMGKDGPERRCARCKEWYPANAEHFGWKDKKSKQLRSYCLPCWSERQSAHYLSIAKREALQGAGITFVIAEGEDIYGLSCGKCGGELKVGDEVTGTVGLCHTSCGGSS